MKLLFFALTPALAIWLWGEVTHMYWLYMAAMASIMILKAKDTPILHICLGLLSLKLMEFGALNLIPTRETMGPNIPMVWLNNNNFLIHLTFDVIVLAFLFYRPAISRTYWRTITYPPNKAHRDAELTYTRADVWIMGVVAMYFLVDLAALLENLIRNMDYLGVNEGFAQHFWEWTVLFYAYEPTKNTLNALELLAIWVSASTQWKALPSTNNKKAIRPPLSMMFKKVI